MKIVFLGTPEFASKALANLAEDGSIEISAVVTQPDRPVGKKKEPEKSPAKCLAEKLKLKVLQPENSSELLNLVKDFDVDFFVVVAYGMILSKAVLAIPKIACVNIHASLLPKYRGASPIQQSLLNGDKETGISIMKMDEKLDHGPLYLMERVNIDEDATYESLSQKLAQIGAELLPHTLKDVYEKLLKSVPQDEDHEKPSYCHKIKKEDGFTDFKTEAEQIRNMIRAYTPWPQVYTKFNDRKLKLLSAKVEEGDTNLAAGTFFVQDKVLKIATTKGKLIPEKLQFEGKKEISAKEFINGNLKFISNLAN